MTPEQFWNDNGELFNAYEKAYINNLHTKSHVEGLYFNMAFEIVMAKVFSKNAQSLEYPREPVFSPYSEENIKAKKYREASSKEKDRIFRNKMNFWNEMFHKN